MAVEKGDRILRLQLIYKLPKDFEGDLNQALEKIVEYRKGPKDHDKVYKWDNNLSLEENFNEMVSQTDRPLIASVGYSEFDGENFVSAKGAV